MFECLMLLETLTQNLVIAVAEGLLPSLVQCFSVYFRSLNQFCDTTNSL